VRTPARRILPLLLAVGVVVLGLTAPGASSAPGSSGYLTMWQHDSYEGQQEARKSYDDDLHNDSCSGCDPGPGGNFGDDMSSFDNNTGYWWTFRVDRKGGQTVDDDTFCVRPHSRDADLGNNGVANLEDEISRVRRYGRTKPNIPGCSDRYHTIGNTY